ncbi:MAG: hypothetical protein ACLQJR_29175 [Stellaceae bacterium]
MQMPPEAWKGEDGPPNQRHGDLRQVCVALVHELVEPLTAIGIYLEAASRLHDADVRSAWTKLGEVVEKSQTQASRAAEIVRQMRHLLR